jgi:hypothetical protein
MGRWLGCLGIDGSVRGHGGGDGCGNYGCRRVQAGDCLREPTFGSGYRFGDVDPQNFGSEVAELSTCLFVKQLFDLSGTADVLICTQLLLDFAKLFFRDAFERAFDVLSGQPLLLPNNYHQ